MPSLTNSASRSIRTLGNAAANSSKWAQCVVARRCSSDPVDASANAPVQIDATRGVRRHRAPSALTSFVSAGMVRAPGPPASSSVSAASAASNTSREAWSGTPELVASKPAPGDASSIAYGAARPAAMAALLAAVNTSSGPVMSSICAGAKPTMTIRCGCCMSFLVDEIGRNAGAICPNCAPASLHTISVAAGIRAAADHYGETDIMSRLSILCCSILLSSALAGCSMFAPPPEDLDVRMTRPSEHLAYVVSMRPLRPQVPINELHSWEILVTSAAGQPVPHARIGFDGGMPQHHHGFPTSPRVTADLGDGRYRLDGMKFSMTRLVGDEADHRLRHRRRQGDLQYRGRDSGSAGAVASAK